MPTNNSINITTAATGKVLQGAGLGTAPAFSTATYPATATGTGKILRADGTNFVATTATYPDTAGTSGNVLTSDGTNWSSTAAAAGAIVFISSQSPSGSASAAFTSGITGTYNTYLFMWKNISAASNGVSFICEVSTDGGSNWLATGYVSTHLNFNSGGVSVSSITTSVLLSEASGFSSTNTGSGKIWFHYINSGGLCKADGNGTYPVAAGAGVSGGGVYQASCPASSTINAVRFRMSSGNLSGFVAMYGVKES